MRRQLSIPCAALLTAALLLLWGCDIGGANPGETDLPSQTKILRVEVRPSPVAAGDTARFTCVIEDSTDTGFSFRWALGAGKPNGAITEEPTVEWIAPEEPGVYEHGVTADNSLPDAVPPSKGFSVTVVEP